MSAHTARVPFLPFVAAALLAAPVSAQLQWGGTPPSLGGGSAVRALLATPAPTVAMEPVDVGSYLAEDAAAGKDMPFRFGATLPVDLGIDNAGTWTELPGGDLDWRLRISSHGAFSIGLLFSAYQLPPGAQLFVYDDSLSSVLGAYDDRNDKADGEFAIEPVPGSAITLEYVEPHAVAGQGHLHLSGVVHDYRGLYELIDKSGVGPGDAAGACETDVNCPSGAPWVNQKHAVTLLIIGGSLCSGSLINNTANDGTQYYMSANHCGGLNNAIFRFNYEKSGCGSGSAPTNHTVQGSVNLASNATYDYHLVRITETIPSAYTPYYLGWTRSTTAPANTLCIHHPEGDVKKISFDNDPPTKSSTQWHIAQWDAGVTEPGSSGSPLMDATGHFMGQLYGGASYCGYPYDDYYGRFDQAWSAVKGWLDPGNTNATAIDGFDPGGGTGQPPVITLVTPSQVTDFQPGQVTLTGSHFTGATAVNVGGTVLSTPGDFTVNGDTQITLTAPQLATLGSKTVTVTNGAGTSAGAGLNYVETLPPKITADATVFGGQALTWNFGGGANDKAYLLISLDPSTFTYNGYNVLANLIILNVQTLPANGIGSFAITVPTGLSFLTVWSQVADIQDVTSTFLGTSPVVSTLIPF
jgi:hypothetical protein